MDLRTMPERAAIETSPDHQRADAGLESPAEFCPVCSRRLESRHCKVVCPRCGFFMSCSEFE